MSSIIGSDLELNGDINIRGDLLIYGTINGDINCEGNITTSRDSIINGNINTTYADISGKVNGDLLAKEKISLSSTSRLTGNIRSKILIIENGASFNGLCKMNTIEDSQSITSSKKVANLNEGSKN
jgi:cytoskeletal protein CcmA (bactofilin family)